MYLEAIVERIRARIPKDKMPDADTRELLLIYAVLVRAKGVGVTQSDVHDAWSAWMALRQGDHPSLVEYASLPPSVQAEDAVFVSAIRATAEELGFTAATHPTFREILFPSGPPSDAVQTQQALDLYKVMVQSSEGLVSRRQAVNTFFLTINGALLTGSGLVLQNSSENRNGALGIAVFGIAGAFLCLAWHSLITSFGQLNRGKFKVINAIERHLTVAIYEAEWAALERGANPKVYRSFTSREIWVPDALCVVHVLTVVVSAAVYFRLFTLR